MKAERFDGKLSFWGVNSCGLQTIETQSDDPNTVRVYDGKKHYPVTLEALMQFAKAGGVMPEDEVPWVVESRADVFRALKDAGICSARTYADDIRALAADRDRHKEHVDALEDQVRGLVSDVDRWRKEAERECGTRDDGWWKIATYNRLTARYCGGKGQLEKHFDGQATRIRDLERQLEAAKTCKGYWLDTASGTIVSPPAPPARVRCIECEHCDLTNIMPDGCAGFSAFCRVSRGHLAIYNLRACHNDAFTPAIVGCGSEEQALRQELIRVSKGGAK